MKIQHIKKNWRAYLLLWIRANTAAAPLIYTCFPSVLCFWSAGKAKAQVPVHYLA